MASCVNASDECLSIKQLGDYRGCIHAILSHSGVSMTDIFSKNELSTIFKGLEDKPKKVPVFIKCEECGQEVQQKKKWQRFCSAECRASWHANWRDREIIKLRAELEGKA
jgi:endogenous inhibitor of DNA gyrase (YacG/DUF329 family)